MKKNGRPKSYTAPYYPHQVEATPELEYLENMHKEKGYVIYHKLLEMASKTYMHVIPYESDYDIQTLRFYVKMEYELVDDCIEYLVHRDFIDKELFNINFKSNFILIINYTAGTFFLFKAKFFFSFLYFLSYICSFNSISKIK